jgi:Asp-tRNA(Asn)/Glu-tRNA(Gln) amidotransferase A subunit family amidase
VVTAGVRRIGIDEWQVLWREDPDRWAAELRNRPQRFDAANWQYAVREWRNDIPRRVDRISDDESSLAGVPFLVKDLFDVVGDRTTCSSQVLLSDSGVQTEAASKNAWLVDRLVVRDAHMAGRTHMNEFAYGLDGRNSGVGDCRHPLSDRRITGGSSSGSAWAVSSGVVPIALGTDTGGSIRLPAAMCGIYGVRLGWDADRLRGTFPLAPSMDTVGWFTQTNIDMRRTLQIVLERSAPEDRDRWKIASAVPPGVVMDDSAGSIWQHALATLSAAKDEGIDVTEVDDLPVLGDTAVDAYNVIGSSEAWEVHEGWIRAYGELYDPVVRQLIERGAHWTDTRKRNAESVRNEIRGVAASLFDGNDVVILPSTVKATPTFADADGTFRTQILRLNTLGSLAGLPALSIPIHYDAIRSGGIQVLAPQGREDRLWAFLEVWSRITR